MCIRDSRYRTQTGKGQLVSLALSDVALAAVAWRGDLTEVELGGMEREKLGNDLYGAFGRDFLSRDGRHVMVVAITQKQWDGLLEATQTQQEVSLLAQRLALDFTDEGARFEAREELADLFNPWFKNLTLKEISERLDECGVCSGFGSDNLGCGCFLPAPQEYCIDTDDDGLGNPGSGVYFCFDDAPDELVENCSDLEPDCPTNFSDSCDVCSGGVADDLGCGCFKPAPFELWYDLDGDGFGYGESSFYCIQNIPEGWVTNNVDPEPTCNIFVPGVVVAIPS